MIDDPEDPVAARPRVIVRRVQGAGLAWFALLMLSALAWYFVVRSSRGMATNIGSAGASSTTMGLALLPFVGLWIVMMTAMMVPSVAPTAMLWLRSIGASGSGPRRFSRAAMFVGGYLLSWGALGALVFAPATTVSRLSTPSAARWTAAIVFLVAGVYQLTPAKRAYLGHCRAPFGLFLRYSQLTGPTRDLRVGARNGLYCVGCCWALMAVLVGVGSMNVPAMVLLASVVALEKLWRRGPALATLTGLGLVGLAVMAPFVPWLSSGLARHTGMGT